MCAVTVLFPALVEDGHLFVAMPPLYNQVLMMVKDVRYALDDDARAKLILKK